jgi:hypothetical protein
MNSSDRYSREVSPPVEISSIGVWVPALVSCEIVTSVPGKRIM